MTESSIPIQNNSKPTRKKNKSSVDHLHFGLIQQQLIMITEEIRKQHQLSVMHRLKDLIFQEEEEDPQFQDQVDGSVLSKKLGTRDASQISSDLKSNPASLPKRVQLVRMVLNSKAALNMKDYRNLLLQACLPIYIGHITPLHLQLCGQVYRLYLKKVVQFSKKKMLTVRSKQLGGLNVNRISMQDLLKSVQDGEESEDSQLISEIKYAHYLLDHSKDLIKLMRSRITIPVDLSELNEHVVVKLPCTPDGIHACRVLTQFMDIKVNMTLCFSVAQAVLASNAGAEYISPFVGRMDDYSAGSGVKLVKDIQNAYLNDLSGSRAPKILAASIRNVEHFNQVAEYADVATCPPKVIWDIFNHKLTLSGLEQFNNDWKKTNE